MTISKAGIVFEQAEQNPVEPNNLKKKKREILGNKNGKIANFEELLTYDLYMCYFSAFRYIGEKNLFQKASYEMEE